MPFTTHIQGYVSAFQIYNCYFSGRHITGEKQKVNFITQEQEPKMQVLQTGHLANDLVWFSYFSLVFLKAEVITT